ncbi:MAG: hypothetical protein G01um101413_591 [Parcubacteria group bacterium Gr01-1014_13]|nr:MAG: hypothetical protein G01um101413_591 [Parcubacteria group bacterium Gr01-1014_13]
MDNNPYRSGPKPEQIIRFFNSFKDGEGTCIDSANKWLKDMVGKVKVLKRDVAKNRDGHYREILIWYLELV